MPLIKTKRWFFLFTTVVIVLLSALLPLYRIFFQSKTAPLSQFTLLSGKTLTTQQWRGSVYLINFWATSCSTCVQELPKFAKLYEDYHAQGLNIVAVAMHYDPPMYVEHFANSRKLPFSIALDSDGSVAQQWGPVQLTPTTFVVDKQGKILKYYIGAPDINKLRQLIHSALAN